MMKLSNKWSLAGLIAAALTLGMMTAQSDSASAPRPRVNEPIPSAGNTPTMTPSPMPSCTPVLDTSCPISLESSVAEVGQTVIIDLVMERKLCNCFCGYYSFHGVAFAFDHTALDVKTDPAAVGEEGTFSITVQALKPGEWPIEVHTIPGIGEPEVCDRVTGTISAIDAVTPTPTPCATDGEPPYAVWQVDSAQVQVGQHFELHYGVTCPENGCGRCNIFTEYTIDYDATVLQEESRLWGESISFVALKAGATDVHVSSSVFGFGGGGSATGTVTVTAGRSVADFDDSGCTDLTDFLYLLDYWQLVAPIGGEALGLSDFLMLLDNWTTGTACGG